MAGYLCDMTIAKPVWTHRELWRVTEPLPISFFAVPPEELARALLGCVLFNGETAGMLVETEAYLGVNDLAAHSARGLTERTKVIFGPAGRAYVYLIYGMWQCLNVVADQDGSPGCVLLRALEPLCGLDKMRARREIAGPPQKLANGPGRLATAMAITPAHYGKRLDRGELCIRRWKDAPVFTIGVTPRIGISESADLPLRFVWAKHGCLSQRFVK